MCSLINPARALLNFFFFFFFFFLTFQFFIYLRSSLCIYGQTTACAGPDDVCWDNMAITHYQRESRRLLAIVSTSLLVLFWTVPVTFVASLTTLQSLSNMGGLGWIDNLISSNSLQKGLLEGFLPTLILLFFMALLPAVVRGTCGWAEDGIERVGASCVSDGFYFFFLSISSPSSLSLSFSACSFSFSSFPSHHPSSLSQQFRKQRAGCPSASSR